MTFHPTKTVREIAIESPATVRVFESLGIDYCCGGRRSLEEACSRANVPLELAVSRIESLQSPEAPPEQEHWKDAPLTELVAHIVARHHSFVREEAPRLEMLLDKVAGKHGEAHPELNTIRELFAALSQELFAHMLKEEQVLFPFVEKLEAAAVQGGQFPSGCFPTIEMPISRMLAEHEDAGGLTAQIRHQSGGFQPPPEACPSYRGLYQGLEEFERDLHRHIHLENNILFPRALQLEKAHLTAV